MCKCNPERTEIALPFSTSSRSAISCAAAAAKATYASAFFVLPTSPCSSQCTILIKEGGRQWGKDRAAHCFLLETSRLAYLFILSLTAFKATLSWSQRGCMKYNEGQRWAKVDISMDFNRGIPFIPFFDLPPIHLFPEKHKHQETEEWITIVWKCTVHKSGSNPLCWRCRNRKTKHTTMFIWASVSERQNLYFLYSNCKIWNDKKNLDLEVITCILQCLKNVLIFRVGGIHETFLYLMRRGSSLYATLSSLGGKVGNKQILKWTRIKCYLNNLVIQSNNYITAD